MEDRIRVREGQKQLYGSQVTRNSAEEWEPLPLEDEEKVDVLRAGVGLPPLADYLKGFADRSGGRVSPKWIKSSETEPERAPEPTQAAGTSPESIIYGPAAALQFARSYRGDSYQPNTETCYPNAKGIPFADCANIIPMSVTLWSPKQLVLDFNRRMASLPPSERAHGIIVLLKTERCATKEMRGCTVTTAALEKRATPLAGKFLIYGVLLKPRDGDRPPGSLLIETGEDAWKNDAAREYLFHQGPGATLAFIDPNTNSGRMFDHTDAAQLQLTEENFTRHGGETPELEAKLKEILARWE